MVNLTQCQPVAAAPSPSRSPVIALQIPSFLLYPPFQFYILLLLVTRMTRATRFASYASAVTLCYFLIWFSVLPTPFIAEETRDQIMPLLPWWLLVSFGSYSLASLGWGLWSFRDCPDAYEELMHEIQEAKNDLRTKGVTVD